MSNQRQNEKRQVRVPIKLVDSDYGTLNVKNKKNKKNKKLNDDVLCNDGLENRNDEISGNMDECQTGVNDEVVREDSGEIEVSGDVVVSGMDHVSDEYMNTNLGNKHGEDSGKKVCDDNCALGKVHMDTMNKEDPEILSPSISETIIGACKSPANSNQKEVVKKTYNNATYKLKQLIDNKLKTIQTEIDENGNEFVIFDDEMINKGSKKWHLTLCGYFVGYKMIIIELRYNIRRIWSRHGFKEVIKNDCGVFFLKFHNEKGMNFAVNNGPWIVNNKHLVLQKWDINMCIDKTEPDKLPLWVKLCNIPLEAWTVNGISALVSRIVKPLIMDAVTASICKLGVGRIGFARVLVEIQAKKGLHDKIEDVKADDFNEVLYKRNVKQQVNKNFKPSKKGNVSGGMNVKTVYKPVNDKNGKWEENEKDNKSEPDSRMEKIVKPANPNQNKSIGINKNEIMVEKYAHSPILTTKCSLQGAHLSIKDSYPGQGCQTQ
nr:zinc knuckle CX2CX4HX4C [Tanacetum cinerariifolium]